MKMKYLGAAVTCAASMCVPFAGTAGASQLTAAASQPTAGASQSKIAGPNLLNNGKFALPAKDGGNLSVSAGGSVPGWTVGNAVGTNAGVQVYSSAWVQVPPGSNETLKLSYGSGSGSVTQNVKTTAGWTYLLQWYESGFPNYGPPEFTSINTLEFADATKQSPSGYSALMGNVSLGGDAKLYLPTSTTLAPTGTLIAVVRTATGNPLSDPGLSVQVNGTWKQKGLSYAPPTVVTKVIGSGTVSGGQAVLRLHIPASLAGKTVAAVAVLSGPGFIPVSHSLTIKVS
jgi:hypothetical protein